MPTSTSSRRILALRVIIQDLLDDSLCVSFHELEEIGDFVTVTGDALEKYGDDYLCSNVLTVSNKLRAQNPFLFGKRGAEDIAKVIMNNLRKFEMVQQVSLRGGCLVSFKLSWEWMAMRIQIMLDDGVDVSSNHHGLSHKRVFGESMVEKFFLVEQGEFKERGKQGPPLFVGKAGRRGYINVDIDLGRLWSSIMEENADFILYITPVRLRGYAEKCITVAKDVKWVEDDCVACCGYQTSINEKRKLACVLYEFRNYSKAASLVELGKAAGYTCTAESFFESALRYTYLKTPRPLEVTFSLDEMLDVKGNTLVYLLSIQALICSIIETPCKGTFKLTSVFAKERELGLHIVRFTDVIEEAYITASPNKVCEYLYDLCKKFTSCYGEVRPVEARLLLCKATAVVMQKCFHLLSINPHCAPRRTSLGGRRPLRRVEEFLSSEGEMANVNCFIPWPVSHARPRPENPRFEMFSMFVGISDPYFEEGNLFGFIRVSDAYGLMPDGWAKLYADDIGHVCYYERSWCNSLRIHNESFHWFGNPSSRHAVAFSSSIEFYVHLLITTQNKKDCKDACYEIYSQCEKLSFWEEDKKSKCDTLSFTSSKDGLLRIYYILLRDAVDTTMEFRFESHVPNFNGLKVCGYVLAYYGDGVLDEEDDSMQMFYKAIIFKTDGACVLAGDKLQLKRSVLSVPANGFLMIEAFLQDVKSGEVIVNATHKYRAIPTGISEWNMPVPAKNAEKGTFYLTVNWNRGPGIIN